MKYLTAERLLEGKKEAITMRRMTSFYTIIVGQPLLKCVNRRCVQMILEEMHEGVYGNHIGNHALTTKILRASYF